MVVRNDSLAGFRHLAAAFCYNLIAQAGVGCLEFAGSISFIKAALAAEPLGAGGCLSVTPSLPLSGVSVARSLLIWPLPAVLSLQAVNSIKLRPKEIES